MFCGFVAGLRAVIPLADDSDENAYVSLPGVGGVGVGVGGGTTAAAAAGGLRGIVATGNTTGGVVQTAAR